jgi:thiol-disulfide isomerase/thioredoxin
MRLSLISLFIVTSVSFLLAQKTNKIVPDGESGKPMLIGSCTREAFSDSSFSGWFNSEYKMYVPDSVTVKEIEYNLDDVKTTIIMGTWCSDSREQVPHFFKVMDEAGYTENNISMICVNHDKKDLSGSVDSLNIELVPTFIFYRDGKELGRIIETPQQTMEEDIFTILSSTE